MAMAKCRECGAEVSDEAKTCPKCGISNPVKKTSTLAKIVAGIIGIAVIGNIMSAVTGHSSSTAPAGATTTAPPPPVDPKEQALKSVELEKFNWYKGGFDSIMMVNATIKNGGSRDVKDIEIECTHSSNSGTKIDSNKKVIYEIVKAGKSIKVKDFNMGFIHSQASKTSCEITDLVLL